MKAVVKLTDKITLEIDERDEMETLSKAIVLSRYPKKCDVCGGTQIGLGSNKDKEGNVYVNAICFSCGAKSKLGRYKVGGYFWHKFQKWEGKKQVSQPEGEPDVPF